MLRDIAIGAIVCAFDVQWARVEPKSVKKILRLKECQTYAGAGV